MNKEVITFKEYQELLWNKFEKLNKLFNENNIFWFAHSGTLLGLIRENGLIPWDDDIDMGMTYKEYLDKKEVIGKIAKSIDMELIDNLELKNGESINFIKSIKSVNVEYENEVYNIFPKIDLMFTFPKYAKSRREIKWKILPWKMVAPITQWNKIKSKGYHLQILGKKIRPNLFFKFIYGFAYFFTAKKFLYKRIEKTRNNLSSKKNWNETQFWFFWDRLFIYKVDEMIKIKIKNIDINVSKEFKKELTDAYGENWNIRISKKKQKPVHLMSRISDDY